MLGLTGLWNRPPPGRMALDHAEEVFEQVRDEARTETPSRRPKIPLRLVPASYLREKRNESSFVVQRGPNAVFPCMLRPSRLPQHRLAYLEFAYSLLLFANLSLAVGIANPISRSCR